MKRGRRLLLNLLLAAVSCLAVLALLEIVARLFLVGSGGGREQNERSRYIEADDRLGWHKRPGARVQYKRQEYQTEVVINSHGLRDTEREYRPAARVTRLLALGDSFVEGYSVPLDRTVSQVIERELGTGGCPVEVINGGTTGYSTDQEYLYYLGQGERYQPKIVLVFLYYNDLILNTLSIYYGMPKPLLKDTPQGLVIANAPVPGFRPRPQESDSQRSAWRPMLLDWIEQRLSRGAPWLYNRLAVLGLWPPLTVATPPDELKVYRRHPPPLVETAWAQTARILEAFARETEARGARLVVVYVPSRMEVNDRDWEVTCFRYGMRPDKWDRFRVSRELLKIGASKKLDVLDLTPALARRDHSIFSGLYFPEDGHWTARGHEVAAQAVAAHLRQRASLPACAEPRD
jgi:lysophospholipase L1-like esterase